MYSILCRLHTLHSLKKWALSFKSQETAKEKRKKSEIIKRDEIFIDSKGPISSRHLHRKKNQWNLLARYTAHFKSISITILTKHYFISFESDV